MNSKVVSSFAVTLKKLMSKTNYLPEHNITLLCYPSYSSDENTDFHLFHEVESPLRAR